MLPTTIATINDINILYFLSLYNSPVTIPYVASSNAIETPVGNIAGIPKSTELTKGNNIPKIKPYFFPNITPHNKTGICIGKNICPGKLVT